MVPSANGAFLALSGASVGNTVGAPGFRAFSSFPGPSLLSHCQRRVLADSSGLSGPLNKRPKKNRNKNKTKKTHALWPRDCVFAL